MSWLPESDPEGFSSFDEEFVAKLDQINSRKDDESAAKRSTTDCVVSRAGGGDEDGKWICIFRTGAGTGLSLPPSSPTGPGMCHQCLEEFDRGQIACSCGGVAMENAQSVYERYITVDEMRACLVLGVDIKPVMADKYIEMYLEYVKVSGGGEKKKRGGVWSVYGVLVLAVVVVAVMRPL